MKKEVIKFENSEVEVTTVDNIIYLNVVGEYTDEIAYQMIKYIEVLIDKIPENPIRVWNAKNIPEGGFKLSSDCIRALASWSGHMKAKRPDIVVYLLGVSDISFGMGRMYSTLSNIDETGVVVLRSFKDLPDKIKNKLAGDGTA